MALPLDAEDEYILWNSQIREVLVCPSVPSALPSCEIRLLTPVEFLFPVSLPP